MTITLLKPTAGSGYNVQLTSVNFSNQNACIVNVVFDSQTTTSFQVRVKDYANTQYPTRFWWVVRDYVAS